MDPEVGVGGDDRSAAEVDTFPAEVATEPALLALQSLHQAAGRLLRLREGQHTESHGTAANTYLPLHHRGAAEQTASHGNAANITTARGGAQSCRLSDFYRQ